MFSWKSVLQARFLGICFFFDVVVGWNVTVQVFKVHFFKLYATYMCFLGALVFQSSFWFFWILSCIHLAISDSVHSLLKVILCVWEHRQYHRQSSSLISSSFPLVHDDNEKNRWNRTALSDSCPHMEPLAVQVGNTLSNLYVQQLGVPSLLLNIKINSMMNVIKPNTFL